MVKNKITSCFIEAGKNALSICELATNNLLSMLELAILLFLITCYCLVYEKVFTNGRNSMFDKILR